MKKTELYQETGLKVCLKCGYAKPIQTFYKPDNKSLVYNCCKKCRTVHGYNEIGDKEAIKLMKEAGVNSIFCDKCRKRKLLEDFCRSARNNCNSSFPTWCKECHKEDNKNRRERK